MATIILEVQRRGLNQYHRLEQFPVTIGRAFDNDIILSDNSVSPHHLRIEQDAEGKLTLHNLSEENGTLMNRHRLGQQPVLMPVPSKLVVGHRKLRLLSSGMAVDTTHVSRCGGIFAPFCKPLWAALIFALAVMVSLVDMYLGTHEQQSAVLYLSSLLTELVILLLLVLAVSGITRLITHRWAFIPALSVVSLFFLLPTVLGEIGHWFDYFFTSDKPSTWLVLGVGEFLLLPLLLYGWLRRVASQKPLPALGLALVLSALPLGLQAINILDQITLENEFSTDPDYNHTLSSLNMHAKPLLALEAYLEAAYEELPSQLEDEAE